MDRRGTAVDGMHDERRSSSRASEYSFILYLHTSIHYIVHMSSIYYPIYIDYTLIYNSSILLFNQNVSFDLNIFTLPQIAGAPDLRSSVS